MKKVLAVLLVVTGGILFVHAEGPSIADKLSLELEFNASVISVDTDGTVESMTDAGFDEDAAKIALSYEDTLWGGTAALKFSRETLRIFSGEIADMADGNPLSIDELYVWVKPFGEYVKFSGGIFENTDGLADYTDDIDNYDMGVFLAGEGGEPFSEPEEMTNPFLVSGFLTDLMFGPLTVQFLLSPNYSPGSASDLANGILSTPPAIDAGKRFFRFGGRIIGDIDGVGTVSLMVKTFQWPIPIMDEAEKLTDPAFTGYPGGKANFTTFGAYVDFTMIENLGLSLGYTGLLTLNDSADVDNILWSGVDLRATWTGIEGLSISTHNNISFAQGSAGDLMGLEGDFFNLYNALGLTKELTERFSVNAQIGNVFSSTDISAGVFEQDNLWVEPRFIAKVGEHAEFNAGLRFDLSKTFQRGSFGETDDVLFTFSIPVGLKVSL
jgi:hypothetical protein